MHASLLLNMVLDQGDHMNLEDFYMIARLAGEALGRACSTAAGARSEAVLRGTKKELGVLLGYTYTVQANFLHAGIRDSASTACGLQAINVEDIERVEPAAKSGATWRQKATVLCMLVNDELKRRTVGTESIVGGPTPRLSELRARLLRLLTDRL